MTPKQLREDNARLLDENQRLKSALSEQILYWIELGPDEGANIEDRSPEDVQQHLAGLGLRAAQEALGLPFTPARPLEETST